MDGWWDEIDGAIVEQLAAAGPMSPEDLATRLAMSPAAVCSCLAMLAANGRVHITSVEIVPEPIVRAA